MLLGDILSPRSIFLDVQAGSVKRVFQIASEEASTITGISPSVVMDALIAREKLGSTGLGAGVAIPHARYDELDEVYGMLVRLNTPVDVAAADNKPADIFFILLAPAKKQSEHARILAGVTKFFSDEMTREKIRNSGSVKEIYDMLTAEHA